jgi:glutaredoxin
MRALRHSLEAWLTSTRALTPASPADARDLVLRNRALAVWLHVDAATDVAAGAGVVPAFHALARRLHVCNLHPARPMPLVCVVTSRDDVAAPLAAHVAKLERPGRRDHSATTTLPQLCVFDAVSCVRQTVPADATPAALLATVHRHAGAADDPTLATVTDADVRSAATPAAADVVARFPAHLVDVPEPLAVAAQVFALHTLSAWDAAVDAWASPALPRAVVWICTAWAPLPAVADVLPLPPLGGAVTWPPSVLNDVVAARARALPGSVLLLSVDALDMPQLPYVCALDMSTGERYVYGQVLVLLEQLHREAGVGKPAAAPPHRRLELEPVGRWTWPQTTLALQAAWSDAAAAAADDDDADADDDGDEAVRQPAAVPWANVASNVAQARAHIAVAAAADPTGVADALAAAVSAVAATGRCTLRCVLPASSSSSSPPLDVGSAEQLLTTVCALPVEELWRVYAVLCGTPLPPHAIAECAPSTRRLRSKFIRDTHTTSYSWLDKTPFAFGFATGDGACWPVATLPPHIVNHKTLLTDAVTPRPLDAPSITLYFAATRYEQPGLQGDGGHGDGDDAAAIAASLLRARAHPQSAPPPPLPLPLPHSDARPRAAFGATCRWLGPHPSLWDVRAIVEPPLQAYAAPHRALLAAAAFPVVVFGRDTCGFTQRARAALTDANVAHTYTAVSSANDVAPEQLQRQVVARRHRTLPCVFVGPHFLGGCDSVLAALG